MLVRRATPADAPTLAAIQVDAWQNRMNQWAPPEAIANITLEGQTAKYATRAADPAYTLLVAAEDNAIVAFAAARPNMAEPKDYAREISAVYTHAGFTRQGAASTLLNVLCKDMRSLRGLVVWTFRDNLPARKLYENSGGKLLPFTTYPDYDFGIPHICYGWFDPFHP